MRKYAVLAVASFAVAACQDSTAPNPIVSTPTGVNAAKDKSQNDYIITLRDDESDPAGTADALIKGHNGQLKHVYKKALKGFAVSNLSDDDIDALMDDPRVVAVERDGVITADDAGVQDPATWGIDRIDQRDLPLDTKYIYDADGTGVTAYIIDTGIRTSHTQFGGRAISGVSEINDGNGTNDCNGHGTHVSGTVGGSTYGVAQNVSLVAVRVLDCSGSGSTSGVIAGIDWASQDHLNKGNKAVANMSLGGGFSSALNTAVTNAVNAGVTFAVAAGNSNANACNSSPSSAAAAITVGATTNTDAKASFSNWGTCVDINAPGVNITSSWNSSDTGTNTISGTSMASPHVAGAAAAYLSANPTATPAQIASALISAATTGHVTGLGSTNTPNRLLYTHFDAGNPSPPPAAVASFTYSCVGNKPLCNFTSTSTGTITSYSWNFGDGGIATTATASHTFGTGADYTVTLTVNGVGGPSASTTVSCGSRRCR